MTNGDVVLLTVAFTLSAVFIVIGLVALIGVHRHRWSQWSEPQSELAAVVAAFAGRPFSAQSLPDGWFQQRSCGRCGRVERRGL